MAIDMVGEHFDNGFYISKETAMSIIEAIDKSKIYTKAEHYTVDIIHGYSLLIALDKDDTVLYCLEMPEEDLDSNFCQSTDEDGGKGFNPKKFLRWIIAIVVVLGLGAVEILLLQ